MGNNLAQKIGERIRARRKEQGLTLEYVGTKIYEHRHKSQGCYSSIVYRLESAYYAPSAKTLIALCKALDCSADYLLGLVDKP